MVSPGVFHLVAKIFGSQILLKIAPIEAHSMPRCGVQLCLDIFRAHRFIANFYLVFDTHSLLHGRTRFCRKFVNFDANYAQISAERASL